MKSKLVLVLSVLIAALLLPVGVSAQVQSTEKMLKDILGASTSSGYAPQATAANALVNSSREVVLNANTGSAVITTPSGGSITFADVAGVVSPLQAITAKAATGSITAAECYGGIVTNTGASGAIVLTLPTPVVGMHLRAILTVAQDVNFEPGTGIKIQGLADANGDQISSASAIGNAVELVALSSTLWGVVSTQGTWTDVN